MFILIGLCNRSNPAQNVCRNTNGRLFICLETDDYGTSYACLCSDGFGNAIPTTDADCGQYWTDRDAHSNGLHFFFF